MECVYIVNTCEYLLEMLPKLHAEIERTITEEYEEKLDLEATTSDACRSLINLTIRVLINSILARTDTIYKNQMVKTNWLQFEEVCDTSPYIRAVSQ